MRESDHSIRECSCCFSANNVEDVSSILESGVDPNQEYEEKNAICLAASRGNVDIIQMLLDAGIHNQNV